VNILAIIPARIGSKGIREKNLSIIGDYTLVERALFIAMKTDILDDIIVSTDSKKIQNIINNYGKYSPFLRPKKLATDKADSLGVIQHGLEWSEKNYKKKYDYVVLLEPPSPFRLPGHIKEAIKIAINNQATSVVSLIPVGDYHPIRMKTLNSNGSIHGIISDEPEGIRRQDQDPVFIRNCAVYVFSVKSIKNNRLWGSSPFGFEMDRTKYSINIDETNDLLLARAFYNEMDKQNLLSEIETLIE